MLEGKLQPRHAAEQIGEPRAGDFRRLRDVDPAEALADVQVVLRRERRTARVRRPRRHQWRGLAALAQQTGVQVAPAGDPGALLDVILLARSYRHLWVGPVGEPVEDALPLAADFGKLLFQRAAPLPQFLAAGPRRVGVAPAQVRELVLLGVEGVELALDAPALFIEPQPAVEVRLLRVDLAQADRLAHPLRALAN